jgi:hypothetical protein
MGKMNAKVKMQNAKLKDRKAGHNPYLRVLFCIFNFAFCIVFLGVSVVN